MNHRQQQLARFVGDSQRLGLPFLWGGRHMIVAIETARQLQLQLQRDA